MRDARLAKGRTQAELAKNLGISQPALKGFECDIYAPRLPVMLRLFND
ncbi:helix-turn-helix domain-containing protein [Thermus oshimai]